MRITVLMGSPNPDGSTMQLAETFIRGAKEADHECRLIDVTKAEIVPCNE